VRSVAQAMPSVCENSGVFKVALDISFQAVNCSLLLVSLLIVLGRLCILILIPGIK